MIPPVIFILEEMPLNANGKINREVLSSSKLFSRIQRRYVAPRNPEEQVIADIWAEVLKLERVGISDNFFEIGGHSLLATQVITRIRNHFDVELSLRSLFEAPTIPELYQTIETMKVEDRVGMDGAEEGGDSEDMEEISL